MEIIQYSDIKKQPEKHFLTSDLLELTKRSNVEFKKVKYAEIKTLHSTKYSGIVNSYHIAELNHIHISKNIIEYTHVSVFK